MNDIPFYENIVSSKIINQLYVPKIFKHFTASDINYKNLLYEYTDITKPCFFYSTAGDVLQKVQQHKSLAIIICNSCIKTLTEIKHKLGKNIVFISTSALMSNSLMDIGINAIEYPFYTSDTLIYDVPNKGEFIYFYSSGPCASFYGYHRIKKILDNNFPNVKLLCGTWYNGIIDPKYENCKHYSREELVDYVYNQCFLSVRLTNFDGLSDTVQTLGLKGIKTIWNGGTPSALPYKTDNDIINHIKSEYESIGQKNENLAQTMQNFLNPCNYEYIFHTQTYIDHINGKQHKKCFTNI